MAHTVRVLLDRRYIRKDPLEVRTPLTPPPLPFSYEISRENTLPVVWQFGHLVCSSCGVWERLHSLTVRTTTYTTSAITKQVSILSLSSRGAISIQINSTPAKHWHVTNSYVPPSTSIALPHVNTARPSAFRGFLHYFQGIVGPSRSCCSSFEHSLTKLPTMMRMRPPLGW